MTVTKPKLKKHKWGAMHDKVRMIGQALHNGEKPNVKALAEQFKCTDKYVYMLIGQARKMTGITKTPSKGGVQLSNRRLRMRDTSMELPITMEEPKFGDVVGDLELINMGGGQARWVRKEEPKAEMVNSPAHYTVGGIETIDYIQAKLTPDEFRGYLKGNVIKYTSRAQYKEYPEEDIDKMVWYALKLQSIKN
jgi:hypothetical protein